MPYPTSGSLLSRRLDNDWSIQSSKKVDIAGAEISTMRFTPANWYPAIVPGTVLNTLIKNDVFKDVFRGENLKNIPREEFEVSWWFRCAFTLSSEETEKTIILEFDGVNYQAAVWLNGQLVANKQTVEGPFRRFHFNVTDQIKAGTNLLAIEVFPPRPGQFSIGFVDWNPHPPDRNMGIFRPVTLHMVEDIRIENPFVEAVLEAGTLKQADLKISAELQNYSNTDVKGILKGKIQDIIFEQKISLSAGERKDVQLTIEEFPELRISNPRLWWPNHMGMPEMYELTLEFIRDNKVADRLHQAFGIRSVGDYLTEDGHRGFIINGRKTLIKGAGWTDEIFLGDSTDSIQTQLAYVRHMNLNCIRLEGIWGKDHTLFDLCDRLGILIMAGWSCHWEHEQHLGKPVHPRYGGITEPDEIDLIASSWEDQVIWLRNHPSIFVWSVGSDMVPHPDLEKRYIDTFSKYDRTRAYLNSTGGVGSDQNIITKTEIISDLSGSSGVKMLGPYDHTPPVYWYMNKHLGGAYGFNTETCPGANVPQLDSVKQMIPVENLWPVNKVWDYHCALYEFSTLDRFRQALDKRYGKAENLEDFISKSQMMNYELIRPMFEAFQANKGKATGIIQWMLNSAWPAMYWQLYDYYLRPTGAFYGAKKACEPLHLLYHYGEHAVYLINEYARKFNNYKARIQILTIDSDIVFSKELNLEILPASSSALLELPKIDNLSLTYFLDLRLRNNQNNEIGNNFYWLSTKPDVLDYDFKFKDFTFYTPSKEFADLSQLNSLAKVRLKNSHRFEQNDDKTSILIDLENSTDSLAFFVELIIKNRTNGEAVIPVFWDDNYISLLPGEKRTISGTFKTKDLNGGLPELIIDGWNT